VDIAFFRSHARLLLAGMVLTFSSTFGQTYFIALFAGFFRSEFGLSHGDYGGLYMVATLGSAATLIYAGTLADRITAARLGGAVLLGLSAVCAAVSLIPAWWALLPAFYGLRLFGQGMTTHVAFTAMAKWFDAHRGRAISIAALGHPIAEGILPVLAVGVIALIGWRLTWVACAVFLVVVSLPLLGWLLRGAGLEPVEPPSARSGRQNTMRQWNRRDVLGDPLFYAILLGVLAPPFIGTGVFFHQVHIVEVKGWSLPAFAAGFPVHAATTILFGLVCGWLTDRWGARRLLPVYLVPMMAGLAVLAFGVHPLWIFVYMVLSGITQGAGTVFLGALWVELYGRENLGSIRSVVFAGMVFASALSPYVMGALIDIGVRVETQFLWMAAYAALTVPFYLALLPVFGRREA
jgi:MFS family permease